MVARRIVPCLDVNEGDGRPRLAAAHSTQQFLGECRARIIGRRLSRKSGSGGGKQESGEREGGFHGGASGAIRAPRLAWANPGMRVRLRDARSQTRTPSVANPHETRRFAWHGTW